MYSNSKLRTAVRLGLGIGAGALAAGYAPGAFAQDESSAGEALEEITVTGSRIKRADIDSASPVTVLDREDIMAQGITDVGNLIQRMPSMSGTPLGTTTNNGNDEEGVVQIDLRGMGIERTVSLVNGKRTVDGGDYTTIPSIMIERVEILKDGASAIYGADAVAGVVNIITRKDFEGVNIDVQNAAWFDTDNGEQTSIALIAGTTFDSGNFVFGAEYINQDEAFQRDTPWDFLQGSYYVYYDTDQGCESSPTTCTFFGSSRIPESRIAFQIPGSAINDIFMIETPGATMTEYDGRTYNYAPVNYMQTPYERLNYFGEGSFDVSSDIQFTAQFRGTQRESDQELESRRTTTTLFRQSMHTTPIMGRVSLQSRSRTCVVVCSSGRVITTRISPSSKPCSVSRERSVTTLIGTFTTTAAAARLSITTPVSSRAFACKALSDLQLTSTVTACRSAIPI
jgi:outer membrane receptor protein involved in Fe transport